jgi:hypothetical protein
MDTMPLSVLSAFTILGGVTICSSVSADTVSIAASGALKALYSEEVASSRNRARRNRRSPDDLPFTLDDSAPLSSHQLFSKSAASAFADSPFTLDDGATPKAMNPRRDDSPFEIDGPAGTQAARPDAAVELQKQADTVNDSPFVLEGQEASGHHAQGSVPTSRPLVRHEDSSFVMDSQGATKSVMRKESDAAANEDDDREDRAEQVRAGKAATSKSKGYTIVRNGEKIGPQPSTTSLVRSWQAVGRARPAASDEVQFELQGSLLEQSSGQRYTPVPGTPFEIDTHSPVPSGGRTKGPIELHRHASPAAVSLFEFYPGMAIEPQPSATLEEHLKDGDDGRLTDLIAPTSEGTAGKDVAAATSSTNATEAAPGDTASSPKTAGQTARTSKLAPPAASSVPVSTQNTLGAPVVLPAPQIGPDTPSKVTNQTSGATSNVSSAAGEAAATLGVNNTNSTAIKGHSPALAVTTKGAIVSILLGLIVTLLFLGLVLFVLHAGRKNPPEGSQEPPRPTRSYRQLLIARESETTQTLSTNPPSV